MSPSNFIYLHLLHFSKPAPQKNQVQSHPPARRPLGALVSEANLASRIMTSTCCPMSRAMSWWKSWIWMGMGMGIAWTTLGNFVNWWTNRWNILVTHVYRWWISFRMVDFSLKTSLNTALNETLVGKSMHFGFPHRGFLMVGEGSHGLDWIGLDWIRWDRIDKHQQLGPWPSRNWGNHPVGIRVQHGTTINRLGVNHPMDTDITHPHIYHILPQQLLWEHGNRTPLTFQGATLL